MAGKSFYARQEALWSCSWTTSLIRASRLMRRAVSVWSMMPICIAAAHCALRRLGELLSAGLPTLLLVLGFHRVQQLPHDAAVLAASHTAIVSLQTYVMIQPMASAGDCVCSESSSTTAKTKGPRHGPEHESAVATSLARHRSRWQGAGLRLHILRKATT